MSASGGLSDLKTRALVGVAAAAVALGALWAGGVVFWLFVSAIGLLALAEWSALHGDALWRRGVALVGLAIVLACAAPFGWGPTRDVVAMLSIVAIVVAMIVSNTQSGWGLIYAGAPAIALVFLRGAGMPLALWTILVVILTDVGAYFTGRALGGPRLSPRLSPKKTWSGLIGGMAAAGIGGAVVGLAAGLPAATVWLGAPLAIVAQCGDLYESALKRRAGVKDSGRLLPGHGGILDRIDGLIPVAALMGTLLAGGAL